MCRYKFGERKCSHPSNMALECVGEKKCQLSQDGLIDGSVTGEPSSMENQEEDEFQKDDGCPNTRTGIYCKKYGYFHCAGEENCDTKEDYFEHLMDHKEEIQNLDIQERLKGNG